MNAINKNPGRIDWIMTSYFDKIFNHIYKINGEINASIVNQIKATAQSIAKSSLGQLSVSEHKIVKQKLLNDFEYGMMIESYLGRINNTSLNKDEIRNIVATELVNYLNSNTLSSQIMRIAFSLVDAFKPLGESNI